MSFGPITVPIARLQATFVVVLLPKIQQLAQVACRNLRPGRREDAQAEMEGLGWIWFLRLVRRGKDPTQFPAAMAALLARAVRGGRRVCGQEKTRDAMSTLAQQAHGYLVQTLPRCESSDKENPALDALLDNTQTPPPEQAAFRIDFPVWVRGHTQRNRRVIGDLMMGERTLDVSQKYGLSPGRVSQLRREFLESWHTFQEAPPQGHLNAEAKS